MVHIWELNIEYKSEVNYHPNLMERNAYQQKMKHTKKNNDNHIWMAFSTCVIQTNTVIVELRSFVRKKCYVKWRMKVPSKKSEESRIICIIHVASEYSQHVCRLLHKLQLQILWTGLCGLSHDVPLTICVCIYFKDHQSLH